jgi:AcrR family transcriptional regulator
MRLTPADHWPAGAYSPGAPTSQLLDDFGYTALTIEGVAARAGVGKTTVYRWWPTKGALVIETLAARLTQEPLADTGNLRQDLLTAVQGCGAHVRAQPRTRRYPGPRRRPHQPPRDGRTIPRSDHPPAPLRLRRDPAPAARRSDLPDDVDIELLLDVYAGAVFYRVLVSGEPSPTISHTNSSTCSSTAKHPVETPPNNTWSRH